MLKHLALASALLCACLNAPAGADQRVVASFYGSESGSKTASGERFIPSGMTAAHPSLPFGARLRVCLDGCVTVRVNDRGPFIKGRTLDLSAGAARVIGLHHRGVASVSMEQL